MKFTRTSIPDVVLIQPVVHPDARGFFFESYHRALFRRNGIDVEFVQDNHSRSDKGVLRGLHYQEPPTAQAKLVRVVRGEVFDVVVDIRDGSPTFGQFVSQTLSAENAFMLYVPKGFAHGFCALRDGTEVLYKASDYYAPENQRGILWNDPALRIDWPRLDVPYTISEKDKKNPLLKDIV